MAARNKKPNQTQAERDALSLAKIESFLDRAVEEKCVCNSCKKEFDIKELNPNILKAAQIRYDKLRPALSAVEQTTVNEGETLSEEQILLKLQQVIDAHPEVVAKMLQAKQSKPDQPADCGVNTESAPQQTVIEQTTH